MEGDLHVEVSHAPLCGSNVGEALAPLGPGLLLVVADDDVGERYSLQV